MHPHQPPDPTLEEIEALKAAIRARWTDKERQRRNAEPSRPNRYHGVPVYLPRGVLDNLAAEQNVA